MIGSETFRFLNETRSLAEHDWNDARLSKLWLYNLHYFDDLNAESASERTSWHEALIARWIIENPAGAGAGWEPYPTSVRIVNWIKWARGGGRLSPQALHSLAVQARWLTRRLERHLLGNHLFTNAKALVFAGLFFDGPEAERWLSLGLRILAREIPEQILPDGGHFELSTMYHVLALEDMLDLINILGSSGREIPSGWASRVATMRDWLAVMTHPDGEIAFFNDAAIGIAPSPDEVNAYAVRLRLADLEADTSPLRLLRESGYVRLASGRADAWLDVARIGPDYLPGHGHADTLSFEFSLSAKRILVNSGTSIYGDGPERLRQRGTAAHNTVVVDDCNSSEIWSGFRVARRARPVGLRVGLDEVQCSHDGYRWLPGAPRHTRRWVLRENCLIVSDRVVGPHGRAEALFHFHPDFTLIIHPGCMSGEARSASGEGLTWRIEAGNSVRSEEAIWAPEFGRTLPSRRLVVTLAAGESQIIFSWATA